MASREEVMELVEQLRKRGLSNGSSLGQHSGLYEAAADVIESLLAERNAAIEDLKGEAFCESRECKYCKHLHSHDICKSCSTKDYRPCWEYRGVKKEGWV